MQCIPMMMPSSAFGAQGGLLHLKNMVSIVLNLFWHMVRTMHTHSKRKKGEDIKKERPRGALNFVMGGVKHQTLGLKNRFLAKIGAKEL